jgi:hypothetical protein
LQRLVVVKVVAVVVVAVVVVVVVVVLVVDVVVVVVDVVVVVVLQRQSLQFSRRAASGQRSTRPNMRGKPPARPAGNTAKAAVRFQVATLWPSPHSRCGGGASSGGRGCSGGAVASSDPWQQVAKTWTSVAAQRWREHGKGPHTQEAG